jgi:hypothetical protein
MTELQDIGTPTHKMAINVLNGWLANANREALCFMFFPFRPAAGNVNQTLQYQAAKIP